MAACSCCTIKVLLIVLALCTAFFIVSLVLAFKVFPDVIHSQINANVRLEEGTEQYDRFKDLPFPMDFKVYLFHIENPDDLFKGETPNLIEKGPYVYKQYRHKTILGVNDEEDTISYTQALTFEFDQEASGALTEDDLITVLNAPLMSMYQIAEEFYMAGAVDHCIKSTFPDGYQDLFITVPAKKLFFEGFNFCKNDTSNNACSLVNNIVCPLAATKRNVEQLPDNSLQFSYLDYKQRAPDGKYTVNRGLDDIDSLGHIIEWNDLKYTNYWNGNNTCSEVKGTDATIYPPRIDTDSVLEIYATDICRTVQINYLGEGTYKDIDGYMFGTNKNTLHSSNPEDDCYCSKLTKDVDGEKQCYLDGVIDMQTCFGVPVLLSFPHFLWADEKYLKGINGLQPDENKHKIFLLVEPNTGTPLQGVKRIQLNAPIRPIVGIKSMSEMSRVILPLLWIEEGVSLTDKYVDELNSSYFNKVSLVDGVKWALVAISAVLVVGFGGFVVQQKFFKKS